MENVFFKIASVFLASCLLVFGGTGCNQRISDANSSSETSTEFIHEVPTSQTEENVHVQLVLPDSICLEKPGSTYQLSPIIEPDLPCSFEFSCSIADELISIDEHGLITYDSELSGTVEVYVKGTLEDGKILNGEVPVLCGNLIAKNSES